VIEGAGLEAAAIGAADMMNVQIRGQVAEVAFDDFASVVGRVVEDLDLEPVARIVEGSHGVEQPGDDVAFVVDRQLQRHSRERAVVGGCDRRGFLFGLASAPPEEDHPRLVQTQHAEWREQGQMADGQDDLGGRHGCPV